LNPKLSLKKEFLQGKKFCTPKQKQNDFIKLTDSVKKKNENLQYNLQYKMPGLGLVWLSRNGEGAVSINLSHQIFTFPKKVSHILFFSSI